MSSLISGEINFERTEQTACQELSLAIVRFCVEHGFAVHFKGTPIKNCVALSFQLSDNFLVSHCETFLAPIIYTLEGVPLLKELSDHLDNLKMLMELILSFDSVNAVILRFSFGEVDEWEYEHILTTTTEMKEELLARYLEDDLIPTLKVTIVR